MTTQQRKLLAAYSDGDRPLNRAIRAAIDDLDAAERRHKEDREEIHRLRNELQCCQMQTAEMVIRARSEMTPAEV